jgi:hypothetical protein
MVIGTRLLTLLGVVVAVGAAACPAAAQQTATFSPARVLDGPSAGIQSLSGMAVARDGTGGLVYVKDAGGVPHVFASQLFNGAFGAPVQVDSSLLGPSSQPVIGAGPGGLLLIAFINGGQLFVVGSASGPASLTAPRSLFTGAANPAIAVTALGKAYLAFTATGASGDDVRAAYYNLGKWGVETTSLNVVPSDDAGTGAGVPAVAASGDGVGIVAWGEGGHVFVRRVWGLAPSVQHFQADPPSLSGWSEVSAGTPSIATAGDSSYVNVAFNELFSSGTQRQARVLLRRLRASSWDSVAAPDGLATPGTESADQPQVSMSELGDGFVTSARTGSNQVWAMTLGQNGSYNQIMRLDSLQNLSPPYAVPIAGGYASGLIAWQHDPGSLGAPDVRARFFNGSSFGPEAVISPPALGPTDAAAGLVAGADFQVDVAIAWVQGAGPQDEIVTDQLYQPPGGFAPTLGFHYVQTTTPLLSWTDPRELWGPQYHVMVDGTEVMQTYAVAARVPALGQGRHTWSVEAVNGAGLTSFTKTATIFIDTLAPIVTFQLGGKPEVGKELHVYVQYSDTPPGGTPAEGSGVKGVTVNWGDGSSDTITHGKFHSYQLPGRYRLTITVTDKAGNTTVRTDQLQIKPKPKPKPGKHSRHGSHR